MRQPTTSVIVPLYNSEAFILYTLESIRKQTFQDFEVIVVNDGSTDNGPSLVDDFILRNELEDNWHLVHQENRGLAGARNTGIEYSRGEYVAFLDADDLFHPQKLEKHVAHLKANPSIGVSYSRCEFMNEDGTLTGTYTNPKLKDIKVADILTDNPLCNGSNGVFAAEVFSEIKFDETLRRCEDLDCWLRLFIKACVKFEGISDVLVYYRNNTGGLSADLSKQEQAKEQVLDKLKQYAPHIYTKYHQLARAGLYRYLARRAIRFGDSNLTLHYCLQMMKVKPIGLFQARTIKTLVGAALIKMKFKERF